MKIFYLPPNEIINSAPLTKDNKISKEFEDEIKSHPEVEVYGNKDFQRAFNSDGISDLGYIVIENDYDYSVAINELKKCFIQHNLLSTATEEEKCSFIKKVIDVWNEYFAPNLSK